MPSKILTTSSVANHEYTILQVKCGKACDRTIWYIRYFSEIIYKIGEEKKIR